LHAIGWSVLVRCRDGDNRRDDNRRDDDRRDDNRRDGNRGRERL